MFASSLLGCVGAHILPFTNPRVVSPPGKVVSFGRRNIIVATPMRSGTHILIDLILNNIPAYRNRPLYVDLDQCVKTSQNEFDYLSPIRPDLGYVLKTHMPIGMAPDKADDPRIAQLLETSCVITIRRSREEVCRSLGRWRGTDQSEAEEKFGADYDAFWDHWKDVPQIEVAYTELFRPASMRQLIHELAAQTETSCRQYFTGVPSKEGKRAILFHKAWTRLLGHRAPRINTTIHTLKTRN